jgi:hypothetical protein
VRFDAPLLFQPSETIEAIVDRLASALEPAGSEA